MATTSLQDINLLPSSKKVCVAYTKKKITISTFCLPSPYDVFLYLFEGQAHKDNKLGSMTNVGIIRLEKVIFKNIHKISDAGANIMTAQCMRNVSTFYYIQVSLEKCYFWEH